MHRENEFLKEENYSISMYWNQMSIQRNVYKTIDQNINLKSLKQT